MCLRLDGIVSARGLMRRFPVIDAIKIVSANCIVLHHLCTYGPIPETLAGAWPDLIEFFFQNGRMAVQPLLVVAGFLAAKSLSRKSLDEPFAVIGWRYLRLMPAFLVALLGISMVVWFFRPVVNADWLPPIPTVQQVIAHVFLVQEWFEVPALSIGVWYVAMDFQLFTVLVLLAHSLRQGPKLVGSRLLVGMVAGCCVSSMAWFNHFPELDSLALYFFGAYGLGVLSALAGEDRQALRIFGWVMVAGLLAYWDFPRDRLILAMVTAFLLYVGAGWQVPVRGLAQLLKRLGDSAYALFLVHFGMIVVGAAISIDLGLDQPEQALALVGILWVSSLVLGDAFHRRVELPLERWVRGDLGLATATQNPSATIR